MNRCLVLTALGVFLASTAMAANFTSPPGVSQHSFNPGLAAAGTSLATATPLVADKTVITTCASGAGVVLSGTPGQTQDVWTAVTGNACLVYPPSSTVAINGGTAGAAVSLAAASAGSFPHGSFTCVSATLCTQAP